MFAYCGNNAIAYSDSSGNITVACWSDDPFIEMFESTGGGGGGYSAAAFVFQYIDEAQDDAALVEGYGTPSSNLYGADTHAQKLWYSYDFVSIINDGVSFVDCSIGMMKGTLSWWDGVVTLTPFDFFGAELSAGVSMSQGLHFSALVYTMAATGALDFGLFEISATGYAGAIGAEFAFGLGEFTFGGAPNGVGGSVTIRWDIE